MASNSNSSSSSSNTDGSNHLGQPAPQLLLQSPTTPGATFEWSRDVLQQVALWINQHPPVNPTSRELELIEENRLLKEELAALRNANLPGNRGAEQGGDVVEVDGAMGVAVADRPQEDLVMPAEESVGTEAHVEDVDEAIHVAPEATRAENREEVGVVEAPEAVHQEQESILTAQFEELKAQLMSEINSRVEAEVAKRMVEMKEKVMDLEKNVEELKAEIRNGIISATGSAAGPSEASSSTSQPLPQSSSSTPNLQMNPPTARMASPDPMDDAPAPIPPAPMSPAPAPLPPVPMIDAPAPLPPALMNAAPTPLPSPRRPIGTRTPKAVMRQRRADVLDDDTTKEVETFLCGAKGLLFDRDILSIRQPVSCTKEVGPEDFKKFAAENPDGAEDIDDVEAERRHQMYVEVREKQQKAGLIRTKSTEAKRRKKNRRKTYDYEPEDVHYDGGKKRKFNERKDDDGSAGAGMAC